jgi:hypothetical protein
MLKMDDDFARRHSSTEDGQVPAPPLQPGSQASTGQQRWPAHALSQLCLSDDAVTLCRIILDVSCDWVAHEVSGSGGQPSAHTL